MTSTSFNSIKSRHLLIVGDVGAGKTRLTRRLLVEAIDEGVEGITVLDLAPARMRLDGEQIGGRLLDEPNSRIKVLAPKEIKAPRLTGRDVLEVKQLAENNRAAIDKVLKECTEALRDTLFVNDASIYLQAGSAETLWATISKAKTLVVNSYLGERLRNDRGSGISQHECDQVLILCKMMDEVIKL